MQEHFQMGSADVLPHEWMDSFFWWYGGNQCSRQVKTCRSALLQKALL